MFKQIDRYWQWLAKIGMRRELTLFVPVWGLGILCGMALIYTRVGPIVWMGVALLELIKLDSFVHVFYHALAIIKLLITWRRERV